MYFEKDHIIATLSMAVNILLLASPEFYFGKWITP